jgi:hypothetical protein
VLAKRAEGKNRSYMEVRLTSAFSLCFVSHAAMILSEPFGALKYSLYNKEGLPAGMLATLVSLQLGASIDY